MIKVYEPIFRGNEKKYLNEAIDAGEVSSGGTFVQRFEESFAYWSGNRYAVAVSSGTAALETAVWSLGLKNISIPAGTIISCYTAAIRAGARVSFHDNDNVVADGLMRVHLFGYRDESRGVDVVDDLSQYWHPFKVQDIGAYSLFANKLVTSGEGGVLTTNDPELWKRAKSYRNLCHSNVRFIHDEIGYNFRMSNLQAAVALAQLEQIETFTRIKIQNSFFYEQFLPEDIKTFFSDMPWMYLIQTSKDAGDVVHEMKMRGIECRRFFYPLHMQPCIQVPGQFPVAENLWKHALYLPSGLTLTKEQIIAVSNGLRSTLRSL